MNQRDFEQSVSLDGRTPECVTSANRGMAGGRGSML